MSLVVDILNNSKLKVGLDKAITLRKLEEADNLDETGIKGVMEEKEFKQGKAAIKGFKVKPNIVKKYFGENKSVKEVESIIDKTDPVYLYD